MNAPLVPADWWRDGPPRDGIELLTKHMRTIAQDDPGAPLTLVLRALGRFRDDTLTAAWRESFLAALHAETAAWLTRPAELVPCTRPGCARPTHEGVHRDQFGDPLCGVAARRDIDRTWYCTRISNHLGAHDFY